MHNIFRTLEGSTKKHYISYYFCNVMAVVAIVTGIYTHTFHNVFFGALFAVFGRVYLTVDFDPDDPLAD